MFDFDDTPGAKELALVAERREEFLSSMREFCDFLEAHPTLEAPNLKAMTVRPTSWWRGDQFGPPAERWGVWSQLPEEERRRVALWWVRQQAEALRDGAPIGEVRKVDDDWNFGVSRQFGDIEVQFTVDRSATCELVPELDEDGEPVMEETKVAVETVYETKLVPKVTKVCPDLFEGAGR